MRKIKKPVLVLVLSLVLVVVAAGVALWLFLGRAPSPALEAVRNQFTGEVLHYQIVTGVSDEEVSNEVPFPIASFTPPEGWTQIVDATEHANQFSTGYVDQYCWDETGYTTLTFSQQIAVQGSTVDAQQEVQFGDLQVVYTQSQESLSDMGYATQVNWVEGNILYTLSCSYGPAMELNEILELVSRVDTQTPRQPVSTALTLHPAHRETFLVGTSYFSTTFSPVQSRGNPQIPEDAACVGFSQPPQGYTGGFFTTDETQNHSGTPVHCTWNYYRESNRQDQISLDCWLGSNACNEQGTPGVGFLSMGNCNAEDIKETEVDGNSAFWYSGPEGSGIGWVKDYYTFEIFATTPMTQQELIALAQSVK